MWRSASGKESRPRRRHMMRGCLCHFNLHGRNEPKKIFNVSYTLLPLNPAANMEASTLSRIGLVGLAVMGQDLAFNIAEKGFPISVYNICKANPSRLDCTKKLLESMQ